MKRKKLGRELRRKFNAKCHWCGRSVKVKKTAPSDPLRATIDHFIPRSQGGPNAKSNLVLACFQCNQAKSNKPPEEFARLVSRAPATTRLK